MCILQSPDSCPIVVPGGAGGRHAAAFVPWTILWIECAGVWKFETREAVKCCEQRLKGYCSGGLQDKSTEGNVENDPRMSQWTLSQG